MVVWLRWWCGCGGGVAVMVVWLWWWCGCGGGVAVMVVWLRWWCGCGGVAVMVSCSSPHSACSKDPRHAWATTARNRRKERMVKE